jgi:hypothetical protein
VRGIKESQVPIKSSRLSSHPSRFIVDPSWFKSAVSGNEIAKMAGI